MVAREAPVFAFPIFRYGEEASPERPPIPRRPRSGEAEYQLRPSFSQAGQHCRSRCGRRPERFRKPCSRRDFLEVGNVYTTVVPIPKLPQYTGDWIIWFAEQGQTPEARQMRAPMPAKKIERAADATGGERLEGRVQLAAIVRKDGHLEAIFGD